MRLAAIFAGERRWGNEERGTAEAGSELQALVVPNFAARAAEAADVLVY